MAEKRFTVEGIEFHASRDGDETILRAGSADRQVTAIMYDGGSADISFTSQNGEQVMYGGDLNANDIIEAMIDYAQGNSSFYNKPGVAEDGIQMANTEQSTALQRVIEQHNDYNTLATAPDVSPYADTYANSLDELQDKIEDIAAENSAAEPAIPLPEPKPLMGLDSP